MSFVAIAIGVSAVATIAGTTIAVQGQRNAATAANQTAKSNAKIQTQQAAQATTVAAENARRKTRENARILGSQRAAIGASGLSMEGTPLAILGESATTLQRDILDIGFDAQNRVNQLQAGAKMSLWEGKTQSSALKMGAISTGIEGISSASSGYLSATGKLAPKTTVQY